jgi:hypothetical protein
MIDILYPESRLRRRFVWKIPVLSSSQGCPVQEKVMP